MIVTITDSVPGKEVHEILGVVEGNAVKTRGMGKDLRAMGRSMAGGDMPYYAELMEQSRQQAMAQMLDQAKQLKADAIMCVRFQSAAVMGGAAEVLAYGTAVRLR
jgi:uncharacterized protein YbjQ (UPF0145 family)